MKYASDEFECISVAFDTGEEQNEAEISDRTYSTRMGVILTLTARFHAFSVKYHTFGPPTGVCLIGA